MRAVKQLVAFDRLYLDAGGSVVAALELDVARYLAILNRRYVWEVERGEYVFALMDDAGEGCDEGKCWDEVCGVGDEDVRGILTEWMGQSISGGWWEKEGL